MRARKTTLEQAPAPALEDAFDGGLPLRRGRLLAVLLAGLVLVGVAGGLAWHQYDDARRSAMNNARARVILAGEMVDTYFSGQLAVLSSIAQLLDGAKRRCRRHAGVLRARRAVDGRAVRGRPRLDRPQRRGAGFERPSGRCAPEPLRSLVLQDRDGDRCAVRERGPGGSPHAAGTSSCMAVPTRDAHGRVTRRAHGSAADRRLPARQRIARPWLQRPRGAGSRRASAARRISPVRATPRLQRQLQRDQVGLLSSVRGLDGGPDHLVAFATAQVPGWTIAIDRPRADVFAAARRGLLLALALLAAAASDGVRLHRLAAAARTARGRGPERSARDSAASSRMRSSAASLAAEVARGLASASRDGLPRRAAGRCAGGRGPSRPPALGRRGRRLAASARRPSSRSGSACARAYESGVAFALERRAAGARGACRSSTRRSAARAARSTARRCAPPGRARSARSACSSSGERALDEAERGARRLVRRGGGAGARLARAASSTSTPSP